MTRYRYFSHCRGHTVYSDDNTLTYQYTNGQPCDDSRLCEECEIPHEIEGPDACLGWIKGMKYVCCSHGGRGPSQFVTNLRLKA